MADNGKTGDEFLDGSEIDIGDLKTGSPAPIMTYQEQNNLFILICEILDNEHDLNRASDQVSPLYLYCCYLMTQKFLGTFEGNVYKFGERTKPMNKHRILVNMRAILSELYPASDANPYTEEAITTTDKSLIGCRKFVHTDCGMVDCLIGETTRGGDGNPPVNHGGTGKTMVDIRRSYLTDTFDNGCTWPKLGGLYIPNREIIGETLNNPRRVYPNVFPKAASVFVYRDDLNITNIHIIIALIRNNPWSIMPFDTSEELHAINDGLSAFIVKINLNPPGDGPFLLHIFKNMMYTTNAKANVTNADNFTFSLQTGQLSLNQVTTQIGWGTKRGSCFNTDNLAIGPDAMIFSKSMSPFMKNCHASYGKLCGDGVTIYATSQYAKNIIGENIPAILSIDEFCCLRAMVLLGILGTLAAAFQQRPSLLAGTSLGRFSQSRVVGIYMKGNIRLTPAQHTEAAKRKKEVAEAKALNDAITGLTNTLSGMNSILSTNDKSVFINTFVNRNDDIFSMDADFIKGLFGGNTTNISKFNELCTRYTNALMALSDTSIVQAQCGRQSSRSGVAGLNIVVDTFFANLGSFESFLETCGVDYIESRTHIVYVMITRLFKNTLFTGAAPDFVNGLFNMISQDVIFTEIVKKYQDFRLNLDTDNIMVYIKNYTNLLDVYKVLNNNSDTLTKEQRELKIKLRKNLVILKYLIRALATCQQIRSMSQTSAASIPTTGIAPASPKKKHVASMDVSCAEVFSWVKDKNITYDDVVNSYYIVTTTKGSPVAEVLSPAMSPGYNSATEEEDSLNCFLQTGQDDEECEGDVAASGAVGVTLTDISRQAAAEKAAAEKAAEEARQAQAQAEEAERQAQAQAEEAERQAQAQAEEAERQAQAQAEEAERQVALAEAAAQAVIPQAVIPQAAKRKNIADKWMDSIRKKGGHPTRKRKPSKIPRRTIRRRGQRRSQKRKPSKKPRRTLRRRQRHNKKGTQKRRK